MKDNHTPGPVEDRLEEAMRLDEYIGTYKEMIGFQQLVLEGIVELRTLRQHSDGCPCDKFEYMADLLGECLGALELILPLAKGYAADNRVGSNAEYISVAEDLLAKHKGML